MEKEQMWPDKLKNMILEGNIIYRQSPIFSLVTKKLF